MRKSMNTISALKLEIVLFIIIIFNDLSDIIRQFYFVRKKSLINILSQYYNTIFYFCFRLRVNTHLVDSAGTQINNNIIMYYNIIYLIILCKYNLNVI